MRSAVRIIVQGVVQGVGFRWFVARVAEQLGISGHAKNRYDGAVEIVAVGHRSELEELIAKVKVGPRSAHVSNLIVEWKTPPPERPASDHFEIH